jgi:hypothetical protein
MGKRSNLGSDNHQHFYDDEDLNFCPNCNSEETLIYGIKDLEVNDEGTETVPVEGMICSECSEILMSLEESCRFLNIKAKKDGLDTYFGVHDGSITEGRLQ